jgi:Zn-dependent protease
MDEASGARPTMWALRVGRGLLGVPVSLHWLLILMPFVFYALDVKHDMDAGVEVAHGRLLLSAVVVSLLLCIFVYLHEVGHALAGLRTRTPVPEILILPFSGAALMGQRMRSPNHEMVVSMAGPLVTLMLTGLFFAGYQFDLHERLQVWTGSAVVGNFYVWCLNVNAAMGLFNLVPMMPLDGGKMFRAFLAFKLDPSRATNIAATLGQFLAVVMIVVGVYFWYTAGGLLPALAVWVGISGIVGCMRERQLAREGLVYAEGEYGWDDVGESWKAGPTEAPRLGWWARWVERRRKARHEREAQDEQAFRARVDELLAKVKHAGMDSLTKSERQLLDDASARFRKGQGERRRP